MYSNTLDSDQFMKQKYRKYAIVLGSIRGCVVEGVDMTSLRNMPVPVPYRAYRYAES
jgi:hypothetical protein